ncbi:hypothetical protein C0J52_08007 [Blattella germanica]|nr:hypothetical protein C0J52_08007 [Blattella germanica]
MRIIDVPNRIKANSLGPACAPRNLAVLHRAEQATLQVAVKRRLRYLWKTEVYQGLKRVLERNSSEHILNHQMFLKVTLSSEKCSKLLNEKQKGKLNTDMRMVAYTLCKMTLILENMSILLVITIEAEKIGQSSNHNSIWRCSSTEENWKGLVVVQKLLYMREMGVAEKSMTLSASPPQDVTRPDKDLCSVEAVFCEEMYEISPDTNKIKQLDAKSSSIFSTTTDVTSGIILPSHSKRRFGRLSCDCLRRVFPVY